MFKVEFFCDDRKLAEALRLLVNIAYGAPSAMPVVNVEKKGNSLAPATRGDVPAMFAKYLKDHKVTELNAKDVRTFCISAGLSPKSYSYVLKHARTGGLIKKLGKGTKSRYTVVS